MCRGYGLRFPHDLENLQHQFEVYDALYVWCRLDVSGKWIQMDLRILFTTRIVRLFCYGFLSLILALYLAQVGLTDLQIGLLFLLTLAGDAAVSLWPTPS